MPHHQVHHGIRKGSWKGTDLSPSLIPTWQGGREMTSRSVQILRYVCHPMHTYQEGDWWNASTTGPGASLRPPKQSGYPPPPQSLIYLFCFIPTGTTHTTWWDARGTSLGQSHMHFLLCSQCCWWGLELAKTGGSSVRLDWSTQGPAHCYINLAS